MTKRIPVFFLCVILFSSNALAGEVRLGTTYSQVQAEYLDMDPKETYLKVLDMGFKIIRLGAYWSEIEKEEGVYDFSFLDWQIDEAEKRKLPIILTVGMKAPRWPEYFIPDWLMKEIDLPPGGNVAENEMLRKKTRLFIVKVLERYRQKDIIEVWQVENEPLNLFGGEDWHIGADFFRQEVKLIRWLDQGRRKILVTTATYPNTFLGILARMSVKHDQIEECLEVCDILGLNIYPTIGHRFWWFKLVFRSSDRAVEKYFTSLLRKIKEAGKEAWIIELQAEPWEPGVLVHKKRSLPRTSSAEATEKYLQQFEKKDIDTILLWGCEYWIYRDDQFDDDSWIKMWDRIKRS